jgi:hypothetical protein
MAVWLTFVLMVFLREDTAQLMIFLSEAESFYNAKCRKIN